MSIAKELDKLEDKYDVEEPEQKEELLAKLVEMHNAADAKGKDEFHAFSAEVMDRFGGIYTPYIFWVELARFEEEPEARQYLFKAIEAFTNSDFEKEERKKIKPLLITYFAIEKEFEVDKVQTLIIDKAHPEVQEYFRKLIVFVEKNKTSVDMYIEKFDILKAYKPDFELLRVPLLKLKERLGVAE